MKHPIFLILALLVASPVALAHSGVETPAVMARMMGMKSIAAATKTLGDMAKGTKSFDAAEARAALKTIAAQSKRVPTLFEPQEDDPKSEALPRIWTDFSDFKAKNKAMQTTANRLSRSVNSRDDLRAGVKELGDTCAACHKTYRK